MSLLNSFPELYRSLCGAAGRNTKLKKEDIELTKNFLDSYIPMLKIVKDFEATGANALLEGIDNGPNTLLSYAVSKSEGASRYKSYKILTNFISDIIMSLHNPYERRVLQLIYLDGMSYSSAREYMRETPDEGLRPIYETTFAERRRKGLNRIAVSLEILGVLEVIPEGIEELGSIAETFIVPKKTLG
ncbi:hypothetical protein [Paenibacillus sp. NPDC058177]|uniref:hypothetical protein n=1 Tax=Paenibacillus sp. NPDC058177 TaxID=3346369 RepID=UPI0036D82682